MEDLNFPAAERILCEIETIFLKDLLLKEFDVITTNVDKNKSPIHHVNHCLGIESWCIKHVYCYAHQQIMDIRQSRHRKFDSSITSRLLLGALLLNPDVPTFWNMRRELVQSGKLNLKSELHFTSVVLTRKPKSAEVFSHRRWLLRKLISQSKTGNEQLLDQELQVTQSAAERYSNNYHSWHHRMWCISHVVPDFSHALQFLLKEWTFSEFWISMHVSDHSGMHYRQFILKEIFNFIGVPVNGLLFSLESSRKSLQNYLQPVQSFSISRKIRSENSTTPQMDISNLPISDMIEGSTNISDDSFEKTRHYTEQCTNYLINVVGFITMDLAINSDLITRYPGHESLWYHRRFLVTAIKTILDSLEDSKEVCTALDIDPNKCSADSLPSQANFESFLNKEQKLSNNNICEIFSKLNSVGSKICQNNENKIKLQSDSMQICGSCKEICNLTKKAIKWHETWIITHSKEQNNFVQTHQRWLSYVLQKYFSQT